MGMLFQTSTYVSALSLVKLFLVVMMVSDDCFFLGDDLALCELDLADEEDIFVWNGVEVKRC